MITSYTTAGALAALSGVIAGAVVARVRSAMNPDEAPLSLWGGPILGAFGAAVIFGALVAFQGVLYFLAGPVPVGSILNFTILVVVLLAFVCVLA
jgi:hypothetical protein